MDNCKYKEILFGDSKDGECEKGNEDCCKVKNALDRAWKTRNFEIELYWKRALYFWGFIASIFLAYATVVSKEGDEKILLEILLSLSGVIFSYAFYLVNRGSKFWQENWEAHIDMLEAVVEGNLYKTVMKPKQEKFNILSSKPYSVSNINSFLSLILTLFWVVVLLSHPISFNIIFLNFMGFELPIEMPLLLVALWFIMQRVLKSSLDERITVYTADIRHCVFEPQRCYKSK